MTPDTASRTTPTAPRSSSRGFRLAASFAFAAAMAGASLAGQADGSAAAPAGRWDSESGVGNHRAVVRVEAPRDPEAAKPSAVWAHIEWRRRDASPERKGIVVVDAATGARVADVFRAAIGRESGDIVFRPATVPGDYYVYYLPYKSEGRKNYPQVKYDPPDDRADPGWLAANWLAAGESVAALRPDRFPKARFVQLQSVNDFDSFEPMETIATRAETDALLRANPRAAYLVFPEDRAHSIRMTDDLPRRWVASGREAEFSGRASRGESFAFQLGLWAARSALEDVRVSFSDLRLSGDAGSAGATIPASALSCINSGGVNWDGRPFAKTIDVASGKVQALWCVLRVPRESIPGTYRGTVSIAPKGLPPSPVDIEITVADDVLEDAGDSDPFRMGRLAWLDSRKAFDDGLVPPFTPVEVRGRTISVLGRSLDVAPSGWPASVRSFFAPEMTRLRAAATDVLAAPMALRVFGADGREIPLVPAGGDTSVILHAPGAAEWSASPASDAKGAVSVSVSGRMEFDGFVEIRAALTATRDVQIGDVVLEAPFRPEAAAYMMGLGHKGGRRPASFEWSWDRTKNQDALWLGAVNAGMQVQLRAENYSRPLNTNFYLSKPLEMPPSWWNGGTGTVTVKGAAAASAGPEVVLLRAASGPRTLRAGETLHFDANLLLTPFKPLDPAAHFSQRYYHAFEPLEKIAASGANVVNIHHANAINPFINYPFLRTAEMKAYVDEAHRRGMKVKIYDTIRELSNRAPELFALRSLGHEIFSTGPGGGYSWLQEHLGGDYIAAWFVPELKDAAIIDSGMSRWHNYYVEGLDWLARNVGIDGLYLDDVAFDRTTMKRARKVLDRARPGVLIDLHSANQYNPRDGFASSANLYLEHFPYLNRLWFGEYFDYGSAPDYWMTEMSGIPFGLMGEMLQDGGNPWRGMVFGMTSRLPWAGDPRPLWKAWDEFGIVGSEMVGWWADPPVKTGREDVLATTYLRKPGGSAMIALASWAPGPVDVTLAIDWKRLGLDPRTARIVAPEIEKFQPAAEFRPGEPIRVEPAKGWLLILR